jgi:hypothetical protein
MFLQHYLHNIMLEMFCFTKLLHCCTQNVCFDIFNDSSADVEDSHLRSELQFQWKNDLSMLCYHAVPLLIMALLGLNGNHKRL